MIAKLLASKWAAVVLIAALIAAGWYVYGQGKELGELSGVRMELEKAEEDRDRKVSKLKEQSDILEGVRRENAAQEKRILEALDDVSEEFQRCFDMRVPDGLRIEQNSELRSSR